MLLILDEKPRNPFQRIRVETKIFLKEGIRHWNWHEVFRSRQASSNRMRPSDLLRELRRQKINFAHNDFSSRRAYEVAWVVKDPLALRWAIEQKRKGLIKTLVVGSLVVNLPHEAQGLIEAPEIDAVIFGSPWIRDLFINQSRVGFHRTYIWPAGVDEHEWRPGLGKKDLTLVLDKHSGILDPIVSKLLQKNYQVEVLKNGQFSRRAYRELLHKARFGVFLSQSESQGIEMFEAWSSGVPTLHWNPQSMKYFGQEYGPASSCYYLTESCGMDFPNPEEFSSVLDRFEWKYRSFSPRSFVLNGYTLKHSVERFIKILQIPDHDIPLRGIKNEPVAQNPSPQSGVFDPTGGPPYNLGPQTT